MPDPAEGGNSPAVRPTVWWLRSTAWVFLPMSGRKLLLLALLAVLVFVGLAGYGDFQDIGGRLSQFPIVYILAALALAASNYGLRFIRWVYYLRVLKVSVPLGVSGLVFLSGLAMSITPGKAGELLKSYLLRDRAGVPVSTSAPVVIMERVTDVISVVLLGLTGLALLPLPVLLVLAAVLAVTGAAMVALTFRKGEHLFDLPFLRRRSDALRASYAEFRRLVAVRVMLVAVFLGAAAWFSEGLALWIILKGLNADTSLMRTLPIYAAATLVGAVSALPGGLVSTEGSMVALLQQSGVTRGSASAGTLLVRLATLWFAVAIGLAALACLKKVQPVAVAASPGAEPDSPDLLALS
jgi:uncharacterized protein (TIRG00374 family)